MGLPLGWLALVALEFILASGVVSSGLFQILPTRELAEVLRDVDGSLVGAGFRGQRVDHSCSDHDLACPVLPCFLLVRGGKLPDALFTLLG